MQSTVLGAIGIEGDPTLLTVKEGEELATYSSSEHNSVFTRGPNRAFWGLGERRH